MTAVRQSFTWKNHRITYVKHPAASPKLKEKIVLIGGWCSVAGYWKLNIPFFQEFGEVIELDLIGHYPAEILDHQKKLTLQEFLEAQANAIWECAGTGDITLVGHSTGGMATLAIAALFPGKIKQVISIAPYVHGPVRGPLKLGVMGLRANVGIFFDMGFKLGRNIPKALNLGFSFGVYNSKEFHSKPEIQEFIADYYPQFDHLNPRNALMILEMLDRADIRPIVFGNEVPTLIMRGEDDPVIPGKDVAEIERTTPNVKAVRFAECGHFVHLEKREAAEKVMRDFLTAKKATKKKSFF
ncbi:alpha/beta fold hydrolase [Leptospira idonii]|uniref:Alpha/beta hydrolase n=1 Tax=Leptospira idonii TaxID=1193500 RepID=A0A4R9M1K7_9LEPT|nr:alpha/beta hydrolase [Leptospira idonii]TGN19577.1 alpha/beta hydrolase [Leptospira idonii]